MRTPRFTLVIIKFESESSIYECPFCTQIIVLFYIKEKPKMKDLLFEHLQKTEDWMSVTLKN